MEAPRMGEVRGRQDGADRVVLESGYVSFQALPRNAACSFP
ncbi:hypothetical protein QWJ39_12335 [Arthrobacter sp. YD4]|nr:hypothetical protein [Arthrobacter sp. YD4]MDN3937094.1 hypothetical protein [Arthrobacter sp. YD4]